jgi:hypothetical protein
MITITDEILCLSQYQQILKKNQNSAQINLPLENNPNLELWQNYQAAFDYFNRCLFNSQLPPCILNFDARGNSWGFFKKKSWMKGTDNSFHEISLNPFLLTRDDDLIFQVLVRQMVLLWQHTYGTVQSRDRYCNTEFTAKMAELGLPCEKAFGDSVSHSVEERGKYAQARPQAMQDFFPIKSLVHIEPARKTRLRYECPQCGFTAMAAAGGKLICNTENCNTEMTKEKEQE